MCGICGFTWTDDGTLDRMVDRLRHRGPDARGVHRGDGVSLGHARLSILDLSPTGAQPMFDESGRRVVVYNGEIYNFKEVRESLETAGHRFVGTSDTEVLLRGYIEWGEDVFARLNGMWAVAMLDLDRNVLLLCRDRLGVKPLFYANTERGLAFASELPSLLEAIPNRRIDPAAVDMLLSSQFIPSPMSIIDGVRKLQPRELLRMDLGTGGLESRFFYEIPRHDPRGRRGELVAEGRRLFDDAVRIRMVADVPVGAFISGGIDSTAVVATMRRQSPEHDLHTVSAGFDLPGLDETPFIEIAVQASRPDHHHHTVFAAADTETDLDACARAYGEPVLDHSSLPMLRLSAEARQWMTVALSGDGADELFGGYSSRSVAVAIERIRRVPRPIRRLMLAVASRIAPPDIVGIGRVTEAIRLSLLPKESYFAEMGATAVHRPEVFRRWATDRLAEMLELSGGDLLEAMLKFDVHFNRLGDNYCAKVDAMSMACSLEIRSPFLDYRFVEFCARVPSRWKQSGKRTKILLKAIVGDRVPEVILNREKHGFAAPVGVWAQENRGELERAVEVLRTDGVLSEEWVRFFSDRVFVEDAPMHREFMKRLAIFWRWYVAWVERFRPSGADRRMGMCAP